MKSEWQVAGVISEFRGVWGLPLPPVTKERKQLQATLDGYLDDVDIILEWKDGKRVVTFDTAKLQRWHQPADVA